MAAAGNSRAGTAALPELPIQSRRVPQDWLFSVENLATARSLADLRRLAIEALWYRKCGAPTGVRRSSGRTAPWGDGGGRAETRQVHTLLVYLDQDEIVLVDLQPEFVSRDMTGQMRRLAYVDRRLQSFPASARSDMPARRGDARDAARPCRLSLCHRRRRGVAGPARPGNGPVRGDGARRRHRANEAVKDMNAAIAAIPAFVAAEREKQRRAAPEAGHSQGAVTASHPGRRPRRSRCSSESHADLAARIRAAAQVLARYAVDPTVRRACRGRIGRSGAGRRSRAMARRPPGFGDASTIGRRPIDPRLTDRRGRGRSRRCRCARPRRGRSAASAR